MRKIFYSACIVIVVILLSSCQGPYPSENKAFVPSDHNMDLNTAFHKPGLRNPYGYDPSTGETSCAGNHCHHSDLKGGISKVNNVYSVAPSCYQCHGKLWQQIDSLK